MSQNAASCVNTSGSGKGKARAGAAEDEEVDEKVLRRRLQYKLHQRRHRAKQKQKVATLELEVQNLAAEVDTLNRKRHKLLIENNFFASRFSVSPMNIDQQEQYLRAVMTSETTGPDYVGVDTVVTQWRRFCSFFTYMRYDPLAINVTTVGDLTVVVVDSIFSIRARRDGIVTLYPSLNGDLSSRRSWQIPLHVRLERDRHVVQRRMGPRQRAAASTGRPGRRLLGAFGANISSSTGQIKVNEAPAQETKPRIDPRHNVYPTPVFYATVMVPLPSAMRPPSVSCTTFCSEPSTRRSVSSSWRLTNKLLTWPVRSTTKVYVPATAHELRIHLARLETREQRADGLAMATQVDHDLDLHHDTLITDVLRLPDLWFQHVLRKVLVVQSPLLHEGSGSAEVDTLNVRSQDGA
ncbi:hypothetical protein GQ600_18701 [Phytophthora cactorum]|nr:hypothetical protein GQ600_18701 [Phytophthora cactorum]